MQTYDIRAFKIGCLTLLTIWGLWLAVWRVITLLKLLHEYVLKLNLPHNYFQLTVNNNTMIRWTSYVKPLSQLVHDHFKTLCDPAFWQSHDGSPTLHELSLPLHAIFRSPAVASDFLACLKFRGDCVRHFLSHWVSRSLVRASCNVVCTRKSGARTLEVVRWFACLDASVVQPWDCCSTCDMWSCDVVLPLHDY